MTDPYQILGVDRDASDEEIKRAYRRLAKQYHPDANPGDETAARKMQEINDAYDRIKNPEKHQGGYNPYGGYNAYGSRYDSPELQSAYSHLLYRRYGEARRILDQISQRGAQWYYLSALSHYGLGNQVTALEHIRVAVSMDPGNAEYLQALSRMEHGGDVYRQRAGSFQGFDVRMNPCTSLCMCWLCNVFCGGNYWMFLCC